MKLYARLVRKDEQEKRILEIPQKENLKIPLDMGRDTNAGHAGCGGNSGRGGCGRGGGKLATNVLALARDVHITPGITETSLMSTAKFANAGYKSTSMTSTTPSSRSPAQPSYGGESRGQMTYFGSHSFPSYATTTPK